MSRYRSRWSPAESEEFESILERALEAEQSTSARAEVVRTSVLVAVDAGRQWASEVYDDVVSRGFKSFYRQEARKGTVMVMLDGREVEKPSMVSVKRPDDDGVEFYQLSFFETMTREQVADKRTEYLKQRRAYDSNIALMDKLTAMLDAAGADDFATAAAVLGSSVEQWLEASTVDARSA